VRSGWLDSNDIQASTMAAALTPKYREVLRARGEGGSGRPPLVGRVVPACLTVHPRVSRSPQQFVIRPNQVVMLTDTVHTTQVRWVYTDKGHQDPDKQFPQWQGESIDSGRQRAGSSNESDPAVDRQPLALRVEATADVSGALRARGN